jgi:hypothetical protein
MIRCFWLRKCEIFAKDQLRGLNMWIAICEVDFCFTCKLIFAGPGWTNVVADKESPFTEWRSSFRPSRTGAHSQHGKRRFGFLFLHFLTASLNLAIVLKKFFSSPYHSLYIHANICKNWVLFCRSVANPSFYGFMQWNNRGIIVQLHWEDWSYPLLFTFIDYE